MPPIPRKTTPMQKIKSTVKNESSIDNEEIGFEPDFVPEIGEDEEVIDYSVDTQLPIRKRRKRRKREGLQKAQINFLRIMYEAKGPLNTILLCDRSGISRTSTTNIANSIGRLNDEARAEREKLLGYPSLITLGLVKTLTLDIDGKEETVYTLTDEGRRVWEDIINSDD